jgi:DNA-binding NarL/FixJ family response regulator
MDKPYGLLLCDDLIFVSRVSGTAKALGLTLRSVKMVGDLVHFARQSPPRCVIIDLNTPALIIDELVTAMAALQPKPFIVGYGSHVDTGTLKKARDAGCDLVWPRSKFVDELPTSLAVWFKPEETP